MRDPLEIELDAAGGPPAGRDVAPDPPPARLGLLLGLAGLGLLVVLVGLVLVGLTGDGRSGSDPTADGQADPGSPSDADVPTDADPPATAPAWSAPSLPPVSSVPPTTVPATVPTIPLPTVPTGPSPSPSASSGGAISTDTAAPVRVRELGRPLGIAPASVVVVGLSVGGDLVEIDLDTGTIRRTRLPEPVPDRADVQIVASAEATIVAGSVRRTGRDDERDDQRDEWVVYAVPLGEPARPAEEGALAAPQDPFADPPSVPGVGTDTDTDTDIQRISPSGTTAVVAGPAPDGLGVLHELVDLATGERITLIGSHRPGQGVSAEASIEWSSDGRLVFFLDGRRLVQHDTVSGVRALVGDLGDLMELRRFTVRPAG